MSAFSTVLLLGSDPLLEYAVEHMLPADTYKVRRVEHRDHAADLVAQYQPRAILVDLPEQSEQDVEFVRWLHGSAGVPVLVLARDPVALEGRFEPAVRVLPRAFQPSELQSAFRDVLAEPAGGRPRRRPSVVRRAMIAALWLLFVGGGLFLLLPMLGVPGIPNVIKMLVARPPAQEQPPETPVALLPGKDTFRLDEETYKQLRIPPPYEVKKDPDRRQLVLSGSLAFDPDWLGRIQSRFQGEVIEVGKGDEVQFDPKLRKSVHLPLRYGSRVKEGQLMAVVWSKDLGEKKSELIDALVKLNLDERNLAAQKRLLEQGAGAEVQYRQLKNLVSADLSAIARIRRTLETWRVTQAEMEAVEQEAKRIIGSKTLTALDKLKDDARKWAQVEIRAPFDGVVVEKNLARGQIIDPTIDLFKIADLTHLAVFVNAYEEDQRILQEIKHRLRMPVIPWRVFLTSDPQKKQLPSPGIEKIGYIVDPTQKTNLAIGQVENPKEALRVGQSVTALVDVPAPPDVVSVPASALVEDGETSVLFVLKDPRKHVYAMRRVKVIERFNGADPLSSQGGEGSEGDRRQRAYVVSRLSPTDRAAGLQELKPGELVVPSGAIELKAALEEVQARARRK
jgi:cobalt-zinc-cadmium efflux system membrane fusion protein